MAREEDLPAPGGRSMQSWLGTARGLYRLLQRETADERRAPGTTAVDGATWDRLPPLSVLLAKRGDILPHRWASPILWTTTRLGQPRRGECPEEDAESRGLTDERSLLVQALAGACRPGATRELRRGLHAYLLVRHAILGRMIQPARGVAGLERFARGYVRPSWRKVRRPQSPRRDLHQAWEAGGVGHLELRVTPDDPPATYVDRYERALRDDDRGALLRAVRRRPVAAPTLPQNAPRFIFHFLRERDERPPGRTGQGAVALRVPSFEAVRRRVDREASTLLEGLQDPSVARWIVALDVANVETDTPVEVFAPAIRALRSQRLPSRRILRATGPDARFRPPWGWLGLAVHAGEDFHHLLEGMRRVHETIRFLDMRQGDRLGHALALGIEPEAWRQRWGGRAHQTCRERLDDLTWLLWRQEHVPAANGTAAEVLARLGTEHRRLTAHVYGTASQTGLPDLHTLREAWELRRYDPRFLEPRRGHGGGTLVRGVVLDPLGAMRHREVREAVSEARPSAVELWQRDVWDDDVKRRGGEPLVVTVSEEEDALLRHHQDSLLREVVERGIAIEVNPSSNLAIGPLDRMRDHPIFRWFPPWAEDRRRGGGVQEPHPMVLVGTDDPAVFQTELVHEYALLAAAARERPELDRDPRQLQAWLEHLRQAGNDYRFAPTG